MMPATDAAMVSALAPGKVAVTAMVGKSTLGSAETGNSRKPKMPNAMIDAVISVVMTGRRIQSSDRVIALGPGLVRPRLDPRPVGQQQLAVDHDILVARQPLGDHGYALESAVDLDRLNLGHAVLHHEHVVAVLAALYRHRRHHDGVLGADNELGRDQNPRPQGFALVVHDAAHGDHAGGGIDRVLDHRHLAVLGALVAR